MILNTLRAIKFGQYHKPLYKIEKLEKSEVRSQIIRRYAPVGKGAAIYW